MNDYTLTDQSVKKLARLIKTGDRPKYQPPIVQNTSRKARFEPDEVDLDITGMAVLLQDLQPPYLNRIA